MIVVIGVVYPFRFCKIRLRNFWQKKWSFVLFGLLCLLVLFVLFVANLLQICCKFVRFWLTFF